MPLDNRSRILPICGNFLSEPEGKIRSSDYSLIARVMNTFETHHRLLNRNMYLTPLDSSREVQVGQTPCVLLTFFLRESEDYDRKKGFLAKKADEVSVYILVSLAKSVGRSATLMYSDSPCWSASLSTTAGRPSTLTTLWGCCSCSQSLETRKASSFTLLDLFRLQGFSSIFVPMMYIKYEKKKRGGGRKLNWGRTLAQ
jgi:hypothetical protein